MTDDPNQTTPPAGGDTPTIEALQARLDALEGMKGKAVDESRAEREKRKALEDKLAAYEAKEKEAEESRQKEAGKFDELKAKLSAETEAKVKAAQDKADRLQRDIALKDAMAAADIGPAYREAVQAMWSGKAKIDGDAVVIDGKPVAEALKEWAATDAGKAFVLSRSSGGGASGGGSGATGSDAYKRADGKPNLTKLGELKRSDPAKYKAISKELGLAT